jgi:glutamate synthase domain-containing protein 1
LQLRDGADERRLGELMAGMLGQVAERGPDSAGIALYGDASLSPPGWAAVSALAPGTPGPVLEAALRPLLAGAALAATGLAVTEVADVRVAAAPVPQPQLSAAVRAVLPEAPLLGTGPGLAVLKGVGDPVRLAESFGLAGRGGYQAAGHTRMATESAVTVAHSHPFSPAPGLCLVHNGSFANHDTIRRRLRADGMEFGTDNDSEVAAAFVAGRLAAGDDLETALHAVCATFDGFYTLLVTTPRELAVVRDAIGCKPALIAEGDGWVAMASEYRALAGLPGIGRARVFEPAPQEVYLWSR